MDWWGIISDAIFCYIVYFYNIIFNILNKRFKKYFFCKRNKDEKKLKIILIIDFILVFLFIAYIISTLYIFAISGV